MPLKIAMIGAGSIGFTRRLMADLLAVPEFADTRFAFTDISEQNLDMVRRLAERDVAGNNLPAVIEATTDRRAAIADSDYVICMVRIGGLEAFQTDIDIPLLYGIDQCVGDTLCAGGIAYGQRGIAAMLDFCKDIREVAKPNALLLNYSNPMAMLTWAATTYGGVRTVGLCHGVQGAQHQIADCVTHWARRRGMLGPEEKVHRNEIDFIFSGINHQTWCVGARWRGIDLIPRMLELFSTHPTYPTTEKVRIDVLKRFGYYSTESNGHLSEYVPWYRKRIHEIEQWIDLSSWINGETGGYLRVCTEGRNWFESDFPNWLAQDPPVFGPDKRSDEHGSYIIEALETGRAYRGHFNVTNHGAVPNLNWDAIVEVPGIVDRNGIHVHRCDPLPLACAATCTASIDVQRMAVQAAVNGDPLLFKQALLHDPLTGAVCDPEEIWQMGDHLLVSQAQWLPQYVASGAVEAARANLAAHEANGTRVALRTDFHGAARQHTKTVEEMQAAKEEARANAQAADKGKMTQNA
jgi:alpha-galactosidase